MQKILLLIFLVLSISCVSAPHKPTSVNEAPPTQDSFQSVDYLVKISFAQTEIKIFFHKFKEPYEHVHSFIEYRKVHYQVQPFLNENELGMENYQEIIINEFVSDQYIKRFNFEYCNNEKGQIWVNTISKAVDFVVPPSIGWDRLQVVNHLQYGQQTFIQIRALCEK